MTTRELTTDILVVGAGLGGVAAALAAADRGAHVILTEEYPWIGGQLTSQAVPPDEHPWVEEFGITARYRQLRDGIREVYRRRYPLTDAAKGRADLNPALEHLDNVVQVLNKNEDNLDNSLRLMEPFYRVFASTLGNGPWFDTYIQNFPAVVPDLANGGGVG